MSEANGQVINIDDDGVKSFKIGKNAPFSCDVISVYNAWVKINQEFPDADQAIPEYLKLIQELGGGQVSIGAAFAFLKNIERETERIKKNIGITLSSVTDTVSTASA